MEVSALRSSWVSAAVASLALLAGGFLVFAAPVMLLVVGRFHICLDYCDGTEPPPRAAAGIAAGLLGLFAAVVAIGWAAISFARRPGVRPLTRGRALLVAGIAIAIQVAATAAVVAASAGWGRPVLGWGLFALAALAWIKLTAVIARAIANLGPPETDGAGAG